MSSRFQVAPPSRESQERAELAGNEQRSVRGLPDGVEVRFLRIDFAARPGSPVVLCRERQPVGADRQAPSVRAEPEIQKRRVEFRVRSDDAPSRSGVRAVQHQGVVTDGDETAVGCRRDPGQRPANRHGRLSPAVAVEAEDQASCADGDDAADHGNRGGDQTALGASQFRRRFVQRVRARGNRGCRAYQKQREKRSEIPHDGGSP